MALVFWCEARWQFLFSDLSGKLIYQANIPGKKQGVFEGHGTPQWVRLGHVRSVNPTRIDPTAHKGGYT